MLLLRDRRGSKRPRTTSPSPTVATKQSPPLSQPPSDDESKPKPTNGTRRQTAASRNQREKEPTKEPEEREPEVQEAGARRKERATRRKGDGKHLRLARMALLARTEVANVFPLCYRIRDAHWVSDEDCGASTATSRA